MKKLTLAFGLVLVGCSMEGVGADMGPCSYFTGDLHLRTCYSLHASPDSWDRASGTCAALGGTLAPARDDGHAEFIAGEFGTGLWVGNGDGCSLESGGVQCAGGEDRPFVCALP